MVGLARVGGARSGDDLADAEPRRQRSRSRSRERAATACKSSVQVEICCEGVRSVEAVRDGGAARVELCADLGNGGVTPSIGTVQIAAQVLQGTPTKLHVLVRPRAGHFFYSELEWKVVLADVDAIRTSGAHGVVVGVLTKTGDIDIEKIEEAVNHAKPLAVTFHRAFDVAQGDALENLRLLERAGVSYLLTSGRHPDALKGSACIAELQQKARTLKIIAGAGVKASNVAELVARTGTLQVHVGSAVAEIYNDAVSMSETVSMGPQSAGKETTVSAVSAEKVKELCRIAAASVS